MRPYALLAGLSQQPKASLCPGAVWLPGRGGCAPWLAAPGHQQVSQAPAKWPEVAVGGGGEAFRRRLVYPKRGTPWQRLPGHTTPLLWLPGTTRHGPWPSKPPPPLVVATWRARKRKNLLSLVKNTEIKFGSK